MTVNCTCFPVPNKDSKTKKQQLNEQKTRWFFYGWQLIGTHNVKPERGKH